MSIKKSECQQLFEDMFTGSNGIPFSQVQVKRDVILKALNSNEATDMQNRMKNDATDFYYKGLLSFAESIDSIGRNLYSWATIKLYYSVFYFIRCSLSCKGIAITRAQRYLFYIRAKNNEKFYRCQDSTDHKGTMLVHCSLFGASDFLLSNRIGNDTTYEWLMKKREEVNYRDVVFHDLEPPDFWEQISIELQSVNLDTLVEHIISDPNIMGFQEDYAILSIPILRLLFTLDDLMNENINLILSVEQQEIISSLLINLNPIFIRRILGAC